MDLLNKESALKDTEVIEYFTTLRNLLNNYKTMEESGKSLMSHVDSMMAAFVGEDGLGIIDQRRLSINRLTQAINGIIYRAGLTTHSLRTMGA